MRRVTGWRSTNLLRGALVGLLFLGAYVLLEFASVLHPLPQTSITAWSPGIAMMVAVVMQLGPRIAPVTVIAPWLAEIFVYHASPLSVTALTAMVSIGCIFTASGLLLRRLLPGNRVTTVPGFALLLAVMAIAALADASIYSPTLMASGKLSAGSLVDGITADWIGDMNGIVALLPLLMLLRAPGGLQLPGLRANAGELALQALALAASFVAVFTWDENARLHLFYLLFVPINWIALRWGAGAAAIALVALQAGIAARLSLALAPESVLSIQLLMVVLAATGLFMGITVSDNARYARAARSMDEQLEELNRLSAVTEFSAAVAHELNNPLSALQNYLDSARLQIDQPGLEKSAAAASLDKALGEANRATAVLRRLRAFFRSGSVQKERVDPRALVHEAIATLQPRLQQAHVLCSLDAQHVLPPLLIDRLQLSVVLHNLLANSCDAIRGSGASRGTIRVAIRPADEGLEFEVADTGPGVPPAEVPMLFHALPTSKPRGMGLGLAISRSLLEANGGRIWLVSSGPTGTRFAFRVPLDGPTVDAGTGESDAG